MYFPKLKSPLSDWLNVTCPRSPLNANEIYQTVYRRSASQRGRLIDGLGPRLVSKTRARGLPHHGRRLCRDRALRAPFGSVQGPGLYSPVRESRLAIYKATTPIDEVRFCILLVTERIWSANRIHDTLSLWTIRKCEVSVHVGRRVDYSIS